jgi:FAD/FMN-containing dehydrogenase
MKLTRRDFLKTVGATAFLPHLTLASPPKPTYLVNDVHSRLNPTYVSEISSPDSLSALQSLLHRAKTENKLISISGGRHSMGAQQFGTDTMLLDITKMNRVLHFDGEQGLVEVESGIHWPELIDHLVRVQEGQPRSWGIAQKQTGADRLTIGGAVASNIHSRGLRMKPLISNIEAFTIVMADGKTRRCSRKENSELFRLVIGGYGLFGVVHSVQFRLVPRQKMKRVVEFATINDVPTLFQKRIEDGYLYGDFQFLCDEGSDDFLQKGVFSCYHPVDISTPIASSNKELAKDDWNELILLGHTQKTKAFQRYMDFYRSTHGQIYWSDTHQLSLYVDDYHSTIDQHTHTPHSATELITEIYVPRNALLKFMQEARADFLKYRVNIIYGTIRLIERDDESFLPWAKQSYACIIFNPHTVHTPEGIKHSADALRRLIDIAIRYQGSYYLTYHKYAHRHQVEACYPNFKDFLKMKLKYDPDERFQSDWYRHYKKMFEAA